MTEGYELNTLARASIAAKQHPEGAERAATATQAHHPAIFGRHGVYAPRRIAPPVGVPHRPFERDPRTRNWREHSVRQRHIDAFERLHGRCGRDRVAAESAYVRAIRAALTEVNANVSGPRRGVHENRRARAQSPRHSGPRAEGCHLYIAWVPA